MHKNRSRPRVKGKFLLAIFVLIIGFGCSGSNEDGWSPFLSSNGTGVRGLDTPDQILKNPYVEDALDKAQEEGVNLTPETEINPPVISGNYNLSGEACIPGYEDWGQLAPGTWKWSNQTADNKIDTDYDQGVQTGGGVEGEIIRGAGNKFTVYSILDIDDENYGGCRERAVALIDGQQNAQGNITAVYIVTPAQEGICHATTVGRINLELTGPAKAAIRNGVGSPLIRLISDSLNSSHR